MIDNPTNCPPQVRVGDIKAFAAARPAWQNRLAVAPEIPTVEAAGLPGFYLWHWHGLWVAPSWRLWQIQPCVSASPTLARKFLRATSGRRKRSALSKKTEIEKWCRIFALFEARFLKQNPAEAGLVVNQNRQSLRFLMHAVFHERAPLKKVDGRVFLLCLHLALSLKLGHPRVLSLGGCVRRHGERAGKQARRDDGEYGFHGSPPLDAKLMRQGAPGFQINF